MAAVQDTSNHVIEIARASPEQKPLIANLLELYAHDFSEFDEMELDATGRFGYEHLPLYWTEATRYPFLVKVNNNPAGFVFVRRGSQISGDDDVWDVAEFFVVRRYRRLGIGTKVAHDVWRKFAGKWEVRVMSGNRQAKEFWNRAINEFNGKANHPVAVEKDGKLWHLFSFESTGDA